jgi:hypothetical protein
MFFYANSPKGAKRRQNAPIDAFWFWDKLSDSAVRKI